MDAALYLAQRTASTSPSNVNAQTNTNANVNTTPRAAAPAAEPVDQAPQEEQYIPTFFCRALYDYQTNDASSLSFRRDDIIEVLTRLDSGWWDGLLGDERGWFPSNYVTVITDQEAEAAFSAPEYDAPPPPAQDDSMIDMAESMSRSLSVSDREENWLDRESEDFSRSTPVQNTIPNGHAPPSTNGSHPHDFWVPEVSPDGRIYYVNTQTGEHARDLPTAADEDNDGELSVGIRQSSSRTDLNGMNALAHEAGFGIPQRSRTPEPWVRRLADDGLSFYYLNKIDGSVSWTLPTSSTAASSVDGHSVAPLRVTPSASTSTSVAPLATRMRAESAVTRGRDRSYSTTDRASTYSDDSDVQPVGLRNRAESSASVMKAVNGGPSNGALVQSQSQHSQASTSQGQDLTPAEQLAKVLQRTLSPNPPESPTELQEHVRESITAVVDFLQPSDSLGQMQMRHPNHTRQVTAKVLNVVDNVRNLLYVTATPTGHIPSNLYPRGSHDSRSSSSSQALQSHLKAAHRKVAGTLSKLVLSALAMQYDPAMSSGDKPNRMEMDAAELERSVIGFVAELHRYQREHPTKQPTEVKRLYGVFSTQNIGPGLPGAGSAGSWKGFGYVVATQERRSPRQPLTAEVVAELKSSATTMDRQLSTLLATWRLADDKRMQNEGRLIIGHLSALLAYIGDVDVSQHVDVDAVKAEHGPMQYAQTVEKARNLLRTLEVTLQALYDDSATLFEAIQAPRVWNQHTVHPGSDTASQYEFVETLVLTLKSNLSLANANLEGLLAIGRTQAEVSSAAYTSSLEWRRSRGSLFIDSAARPNGIPVPEEDEDVVDMELAFSRPGVRTIQTLDNGLGASGTSAMYTNGVPHHSATSLGTDRSHSEGPHEPVTPTWPSTETDDTGTYVGTSDAISEMLDDFDDEGPGNAKSPPRAAKLMKLLGEVPQPYINKVNAEQQPWYLRPNYDQNEILIDPDGGVRAGTKQALIERLTAHETADPTFNKQFMITFKSFMELDELFELLVQRYWIKPPENLTAEELDTWTKQKQNMIRLRVLNTFRTMITDEDILEKDDAYILDRIREFCLNPEVQNSSAAAKQLVVLIDRQRGGEGPIKTSNTLATAPPPPILPKNMGKKTKLLEIDPQELARQLTVMESQMYKKIRPVECLRRSREQRVGKNDDNIASIIRLSNRIANWVAESVLSKEDSRKRAAVVKHFILIADRCRLLQNFSSMVAITSGLNTPPIRRLKRTWEQVNQKLMQQLAACESTIDSNKNFSNYRSTLARISPPCVPFIGTYLTTLTFINDGAEDKVAGNMINFRKRQKAAEVIQDIKRWQAMPYNLNHVATVISWLEDCFGKYTDGVDYGDQFWHLSLEREPREREDEKMARLLQESGFL